MSETGENLPPKFEQVGGSVIDSHNGISVTYGDIVELNDARYQLTQPLRTALEKHPDTIIAEEPFTQYYGNGETQDQALISLREILITFREEIGNSPDDKLSSHLQGHKRFLVKLLEPKSLTQAE